MTASEIRFLTIETVQRLHEIAIADQGGDSSIRDRGLLESALATPQQRFAGEYPHPTIPSTAAAYAFHLAKNPPFVDGNKRAAFSSMIAFLTLNGWRFDADESDSEASILALASGTLSKDVLIDWVSGNCHEKPSMELREFFSCVTFDSLIAQLTAFQLGAKEVDIQRSTDEASEHTPLLRSLDQITTHESEPIRQALCIGSVLTLTSLHRLAEDMGYEW